MPSSRPHHPQVTRSHTLDHYPVMGPPDSPEATSNGQKPNCWSTNDHRTVRSSHLYCLVVPTCHPVVPTIQRSQEPIPYTTLFRSDHRTVQRLPPTVKNLTVGAPTTTGQSDRLTDTVWSTQHAIQSSPPSTGHKIPHSGPLSSHGTTGQSRGYLQRSKTELLEHQRPPDSPVVSPILSGRPNMPSSRPHHPTVTRAHSLHDALPI